MKHPILVLSTLLLVLYLVFSSSRPAPAPAPAASFPTTTAAPSTMVTCDLDCQDACQDSCLASGARPLWCFNRCRTVCCR